MLQAILSAQKTDENGGAQREYLDYTYSCAEGPAGSAPAMSGALIVEPGSALLFKGETLLWLRARQNTLRAR
jgi:hypothetical protein